MDAEQIVGRWYEAETIEDDSDGAFVTLKTRTVTQYFGNGKFNSEGHLIVERVEGRGKDRNVVETFCKIFANGEWELNGVMLYETLQDTNIQILEMFVNDAIIPDKNELKEYEHELKGLIPNGIVVELTVKSYRDNLLTYTQIDDEGRENLKERIKTNYSYSKYVEKVLKND